MSFRREGDLDKATYQIVRSSLDFRPRLAPTAAILAMDVVLLATAEFLLSKHEPAPFWLAQGLLAIVFFNGFSILHECGHGNISSRRAVNTVLGHVASTFCFIPYYPWKYIHQKHHLWAGNLERDPVLRSIRRFRDDGVPAVVRFCWRSWVPLGALLQHVVYLTYPVVMQRAGELTPSKARRVAVSLAWLPISYVGLRWLAPEIFRFSQLVPALVVFLVMEELVNIPHHVDMPVFQRRLDVWDQYRTTRSCYYPPVLSELFVLNFNFHIEHHVFPRLPWYRLRRARRLLRSVLGDRYAECRGISWNLHNRRRDLNAIIARYRRREDKSL